MRIVASSLTATVAAFAVLYPTQTVSPTAANAARVANAPSITNHTIRMVGDGQSYRFDPSDLEIKQGDSVTFVMVSGGPHNVAFDAQKLSADAKTALNEGMPDRMSDVAGKFMMAPTESYTISFARVPVGEYEFFCAPHLAMAQKGKIVVIAK